MANIYMSCKEQTKKDTSSPSAKLTEAESDETPDYFPLRQEVETAYRYSHAVEFGKTILKSMIP